MSRQWPALQSNHSTSKSKFLLCNRFAAHQYHTEIIIIVNNFKLSNEICFTPFINLYTQNIWYLKEKRESRSWFSERKIAVVRDLEQGPRDLWIQRMASFAIGRITKYEPQDTRNFNLRTWLWLQKIYKNC